MEPGHRRSILWYLALTFAATYAIEGWAIARGVRFDAGTIRTAPALWLVGVMWIPGLTALIMTKFMERASLRDSLSLRMGPITPYLLAILIAPLAFATMYGASWLLGLTAPDTTLSGLTRATGDDALTTETVFKTLLPLSVVLGPLINFIFGLGEEIGWRGFLLPRLMGLGKWRAYLALGLIWGVWHAPLIWAGFNYPGTPVAGMGMMILLCFAFGLFLNEMTLHYRSVLLAGFIHGAVNAQGFGIWPWLFPDTDPVLGGGTGLTGVVVWLFIGGLAMTILQRRRANITD